MGDFAGIIIIQILILLLSNYDYEQPIACSDVCDNARYVHPGENGVLFDPRSDESIAEALQGLLAFNDEGYECYCRNSRTLAAVANFSKERFVESYIELVEKKLE